MSEGKLRGLYSPSTKKVACVLISAAFECDREVSLMFDTSQWFVAPEQDMVLIESPRWQWEAIAAMPPEKRPGPDLFNGYKRAMA